MVGQSGSDGRVGFDLSPERPIVSREADVLGRVPFAEYIAAAIRGWTGNDSLVLALCGEWGTGKSSLKNLVVEALRSNPKESPYIVEFNPWQWAGQEQVSQAFFREIGSELGRKDSGSEAKASAKRWQKYGAFLGLGTEVFAGTRRIALVGLAISVFEPELFKTLPACKAALTGSSRSTRELTEKSEVEAVVQKASEQTRDNVRAILKSVFPPASWTSGGSHYEGYSDVCFREHRACHPDLFDKYFHMTIPEGDISLEELGKIVSLAADRVALVSELRALGQRQLLDVAMDRLESYKETVNLDHALTFVTALLDVGDELPLGNRGFLEIPAEMHATRIIYWYLKREPSLARRAEVLTQCINETTGIYLPAYVVAIEGDKLKEGREENSRLVDGIGLKRLQEACSAKIQLAAEQGTLLRHSRLAQLLSLWQAWSSSEQPREWVHTLIDSPDGLLSFLVACLQETRSQSSGSYTVRSIWRIDLQFVEKFVASELVESKLADLSRKDLQEKEQEAVKAFHKAMKRKREGKQGFSPFDEE